MESHLLISTQSNHDMPCALVVARLAVVTLQPQSTEPSVAGCRLVGCSVISRGPLHSLYVAASLHQPGARSGLQCPVPACCRLTGAGLGSHYGVEFGQSRTG
jgi:hypothetical protein